MSSKLNFCTLFDSNYLIRGLTLYYSLKANCEYFHLYIFAFDDRCFQILTKLNLQSVTVIPLRSFETSALLKVKKSRSTAEYCWTCTPAIIWHCLKNYSLDQCTYLDADTFFFKTPAILFKEMGTHSVLITKHNYTSKYDQSKKSGIYCVQFIMFKSDTRGLKVLRWWKNACLDWCFNRYEDGKFGDQKYLDDWPEKFNGIHVVKHEGGGVAPWNIQQISVFEKNSSVWARNILTHKEFPIIFYHFHGIKIYQFFNQLTAFSPLLYSIDRQQWNTIYKKYVSELHFANKAIRTVDLGFSYGTFSFSTLIFDILYKYVVSSPYAYLKKNTLQYEVHG